MTLLELAVIAEAIKTEQTSKEKEPPPRVLSTEELSLVGSATKAENGEYPNG